jgi:antibiotic biosynthesis monooxygenase (ABM) superfamily enzyme
MAGMTRRKLMRVGGLAASAVTLLAAAKPGEVRAEIMAPSVFHVFAFQWKPGVTEAQKARAAREIAALQGKIPGLLETHVGPNISPRGKGYTFGGIMQFKDRASLEAYPQQPAHQALVAWLMPLIDAIELDLCTK